MTSLHARFFDALAADAARSVVLGDGPAVTYGQLGNCAISLAHVARSLLGRPPKRVAVISSRGTSALAGLLACSVAGATYVPLLPTTPARRLRQMVELARPEVILHADGTPAWMLEVIKAPAVAIDTAAAFPSTPLSPLPEPESASPAYILFTSGSTGAPKAVPIEGGNIGSFVTSLTRLCQFTESDVFLQLTEPTFDVSFIATLGAWAARGALFMPAISELALRPAATLRRGGVTVWTSVPSAAEVVLRRHLAESSLACLRLSLFCGERLLAATAAGWSKVTRGAVIVNLYGPTEATVAVLAYAYPGACEPGAWVKDVVPIGTPLPGVTTRIVDPQTLVPAEEGELWVGGMQNFDGYLGAAEIARSAFAPCPETGERFYRTGDLVRRSRDGTIHFKGRLVRQPPFGL